VRGRAYRRVWRNLIGAEAVHNVSLSRVQYPYREYAPVKRCRHNIEYRHGLGAAFACERPAPHLHHEREQNLVKDD
jgi:hypothetical protein